MSMSIKSFEKFSGTYVELRFDNHTLVKNGFIPKLCNQFSSAKHLCLVSGVYGSCSFVNQIAQIITPFSHAIYALILPGADIQHLSLPLLQYLLRQFCHHQNQKWVYTFPPKRWIIFQLAAQKCSYSKYCLLKDSRTIICIHTTSCSEK